MNKYVVTLVAATVLVGCLKTRAELEAEETGRQQQKVTVAQQQAAANEPTAAPRAAHVAGQAVAQPHGEEFDEQMRGLNGRIESNEAAVAQIRAAGTQEKEQAAREKQALDQKLQVYEEALRKIETQVQSLTDEVARLKAPPQEISEKSAAAPAGKKVAGKNGYESGEELFTSKKWKEAIISYQKYRDQNPKGKQYADATYKIGVCFQELGMKDEAKSFMEEVTAKFPHSKEAKKAAFRLKTLK